MIRKKPRVGKAHLVVSFRRGAVLMITITVHGSEETKPDQC